MDKFQAAFEILYLLSTADDVFDEREVQVIVNFLIAIELIAADGRISDEEGYLFTFLANIWNIDLRRFLNS